MKQSRIIRRTAARIFSLLSKPDIPLQYQVQFYVTHFQFKISIPIYLAALSYLTHKGILQTREANKPLTLSV